MRPRPVAASRTPPFAFDGPGRLLAPVLDALRWVIDPRTGADIVAGGVLRAVRIDAEGIRVTLALVDDAVTQVICEDVQTELGDRFAEHQPVRVRLQAAASRPA